MTLLALLPLLMLPLLLVRTGTGLMRSTTGLRRKVEGSSNCCCDGCPDCCTFNGDVVGNGLTIPFGGDDDVADALCPPAISPSCANIGVVNGIPAPPGLFVQDPIAFPDELCHTEELFMEVITWCQIEGETQRFHVTHSFYTFDPITGELFCCPEGPTDSSVQCDPNLIPYTANLGNGWTIDFP